MDNGTQDPHQPAPATEVVGPGLSLSALQRRRMLLRGVGKGAAVVGAAVPMQTFAANILRTPGGDGKPSHVCSMSGGTFPSNRAPDVNTCSGKSAAYWADTNTPWPQARVTIRQNPMVKQAMSASAWSRETRFSDVFGGTSQETLGRVLSGSQGEHQTWVRALLNAHDGYPASFPYSPTEVVQLYQDPGKRTAATTFFRDWV